jgi:hypothetical protein
VCGCGLAKNRDQWQAVSTAIKFNVSESVENFKVSCGTFNFSRGMLLHGVIF